MIPKSTFPFTSSILVTFGAIRGTRYHKQDAAYYWFKDKNGTEIDYHPEQRLTSPVSCSAFTIIELGEMLPQDMASYKERTDWCIDN
jgi:hypothetical protein